MIKGLHFAIFAHSWRSDWNHGNAHFLRGLARELGRLGHDVRCYEPENSWSFCNLQSEGDRAMSSLRQFIDTFPELDVRTYRESETDLLLSELRGIDIVIIHEWNSPKVVNSILRHKPTLHFHALFHDTHHRAHTSPHQLRQLDLESFDGVLAFGDAIRRIYLDTFGVRKAWTFHEAADVDQFFPLEESLLNDVVWIGNWGDDERVQELTEFLLQPLARKRMRSTVYGVRYPASARAQLQAAGITYGGYLPNLSAPAVYAQSALTLHIPRRYYNGALSGIPTIRVFEALACGIPLVCSPWADDEQLFRPHQDYTIASDGKAMAEAMSWLTTDRQAAKQIAANGRETVLARHTCAHRAEQLMEIIEELDS
jgi:spore maturation protein CgeB